MNPQSLTRQSSLAAARLDRFLTLGSIAIGITAIALAAPAQAVSLTGKLDFNNETRNFINGINPLVANDTFNVTFNPTSGSGSSNPNPANVTATTGSFASSGLFPSTGTYGINAPTATFQRVSASSATSFVYKLINNNLDFNFTNGVKLSIGQNSTFAGVFNQATNPTQVNFSILNNVGSAFTSGTNTVPASPLVFNFSDSSASGGAYNISATTAVPEPLSAIGTLVGGTVALRLKKKLKSTAKS